MADAKGVAAEAGRAVAGAAKSAVAAAGVFFEKHPPSGWLEKTGPAGAWVKTHKGPAVAISAAVFLILLVIIIRAFHSGTAPVTNNNTGTNANTNANAGAVNPPGGAANAKPNPNAVDANKTITNLMQQAQQQQQAGNPANPVTPANAGAAANAAEQKALETEYNAGMTLGGQAQSVNDPRYAEGLNMLTDAGNRGYTPAMMSLARFYANGGNFNMAVYWGKKAQAANDPTALPFLRSIGAN